MGRSFLLDTSAFILGYERPEMDAEYYTVPSVQEELKGSRLPKMRLDAAVQTGRLKLQRPEAKYIEVTEAAATELGETDALSQTDGELLALGVQLMDEGRNPIIITDDYSVQNMADFLGLEFGSLATSGIKSRFNWVIYCPGCYKSFSGVELGGECPICGVALRRRPVKKSPVRDRSAE